MKSGQFTTSGKALPGKKIQGAVMAEADGVLGINPEVVVEGPLGSAIIRPVVVEPLDIEAVGAAVAAKMRELKAVNRSSLELPPGLDPRAMSVDGLRRKVEQRFAVDTAWFKEKLAMADMSMRTLGKRIGLDVSAVSLMLSGKRKMTIQEAGSIASQIGASVEEVLRRAGVEEMGFRESLVTIHGHAVASGGILAGHGDGPASVPGPGAPGLKGIWVAEGRMAGWVLMYQPGRGIPPEAMGALCVIDGSRVTWVDKGWQPGEFKVTGLDGDVRIERISSAVPILWARQ
jgi:hypothetical protein